LAVQHFLLTIGLVFVALALLWPVIQKLGLGRLPGDIVIERDSYKIYFPIATSILVSLVVTLIVWLMRK
jgi:hypothetical protein